MRHFLCLLVCSLLFFISLQAQPVPSDLSQYSLDTWQTEQGLPQNTIQSVLQTRDGFIWLATEEGLVRFDGVNMTVFDQRNTPAFKQSYVQRLLEGRDGTLWITTTGGLIAYKAGKFTPITSPARLVSSSVFSLMEDRQGYLWIGTRGEGLWRFKDGSLTTFTTADGLANNTIWNIREDHNGAIWLATNGGLCRYQSGRFITLGKAAGLPTDRVTSILETRDNTLWVGTEAGLARYQDNRFVTYTEKDGLPNEEIRELVEDNFGSLWIGTDGGGVSRLRNGKFSNTGSKQGLVDDSILSIFADKEGSIWIGTVGGGLGRLRPSKFISYSTDQGLPNNVVRSLLQRRNGEIWVGTEGGFGKMDGQGFVAFKTSSKPANDIVLSLFEDREGALLVGTTAGLKILKNGNIRHFTTKDGLSSNDIRAIYQDRSGAYWLATRKGGLDVLQNGKFTNLNRTAGFPTDTVRVFFEDSKGQIWIGSSAGLSLWQNGSFKTYSTADGLSYNSVYDIYEDSDGAIWIATDGGGLNRLKDGRLSFVRNQQGLYDDVVFRILDDDHGSFWMSCNRGIFRVSKQMLNDFLDKKIPSVQCTVFGIADGMRSAECNGGSQFSGIKATDGRLWFPTIKGIVVVDPRNLPTNPLIPPVVVESFSVDQHPVDLSRSYVFEPGNGSLEFRYAALSFLAPGKVKFKYKLEGFDPDWIDADTRRVAYYTNIPPGRYQFRVIACNNDGLWNNEGVTLAFYLRPHIYQTWWFYLLCTGLVVFGAIFAWRQRVRVLRLREIELTRRVDHYLAGGDLAALVTQEFPDAAQRALMAARVVMVEGDHDLLTVIAPDRRGLFSRVSGVLALHGLEVRSADAASEDGMAIEQFRVTSRFSSVIPWDRVVDHVHDALDERLAIEARLADRIRTYQARTLTPRLPPPVVRFDDAASTTATVVEVHAPDRMGLLFRVSKAFAELGIDVRVAKVQTLGDLVVDAFYITHPDGSMVTDPEIRSELERALLHAVAQPGAS